MSSHSTLSLPKRALYHEGLTDEGQSGQAGTSRGVF